MGNITDKPKAPSPQVIYVPQTVYEPVSGNSGSNDNSGGIPSAAEMREKSLLSRSRSKIGTIMTGFRGLLTPLTGDAQRKTLLGE
jgi:hypothetical protein